MKFPWRAWSDGVLRPILLCSIRHGTTVLPTDLPILLDTGADTTTFPRNLASLLGFTDADLTKTSTNAVGGLAATWLAKSPPGIEVEIGGQWYALPGLAFAETPPLFGRDFIFAHFRLRMEHGETELKPR